jgi:SAM-dependent methyltransferase
MSPATLPAPAAAFDSIAESFDDRFGGWLSVAAQRRAVRRELADAFPVGSRVLELGGGTGEDALWLASLGRHVLLTDASPGMVSVSARKGADVPHFRAEVAAAERIGTLADRGVVDPGELDGAFSNFAALNCVSDLSQVARGLARLIRPGGQLLLVLFGPLPPGEVLVQALRGRPRAGLRRLGRGEVSARLNGHSFTVRYHRPGAVRRAMEPYFRPVSRVGVGVLVPPSDAEPWISRHPRLLAMLEGVDRVLSRPLALLGDHVLYRFERTGAR